MLLCSFIFLLAKDIPLLILPERISAGLFSFPLLAMPFFILAGNLMMASGLSRIGEVFRRIVDGEAQRGLAHATSGPCLQHNLVTVLESA